MVVVGMVQVRRVPDARKADDTDVDAATTSLNLGHSGKEEI